MAIGAGGVAAGVGGKMLYDKYQEGQEEGEAEQIEGEEGEAEQIEGEEGEAEQLEGEEGEAE